MFFTVQGCAGTGKYAVADMLTRQGFQLIEIKEPPKSASFFSNQLAYLSERLKVHLEAQAVANKKDVVTVHSPYDTHVVYSKLLLKQEKISQAEYEDLAYLYHAMLPIIEPPHAAIFTSCSSINAQNRMTLRGKSIHEQDLIDQLKSFKEFSTNIKIPQVEVNFDESMEIIQKDFIFNFASLKTTGVTNQTLWAREMFHVSERPTTGKSSFSPKESDRA